MRLFAKPEPAVQRLRQWVDERTDLTPAALARFRGDDWWQITACEQDVFALTLEDMARILPIHEAYEAMTEIVENDLWQDRRLRVALQKEFDWITRRTSDEAEFRRFADVFSVSPETAHSFYWKHQFWLLRQGLVSF